MAYHANAIQVIVYEFECSPKVDTIKLKLRCTNAPAGWMNNVKFEFKLN